MSHGAATASVRTLQSTVCSMRRYECDTVWCCACVSLLLSTAACHGSSGRALCGTHVNAIRVAERKHRRVGQLLERNTHQPLPARRSAPLRCGRGGPLGAHWQCNRRASASGSAKSLDAAQLLGDQRFTAVRSAVLARRGAMNGRLWHYK